MLAPGQRPDVGGTGPALIFSSSIDWSKMWIEESMWSVPRPIIRFFVFFVPLRFSSGHQKPLHPSLLSGGQKGGQASHRLRLANTISSLGARSADALSASLYPLPSCPSRSSEAFAPWA